MTVDEFLRWAEDQPGRWELYDGVPTAMSPQRAVHALAKFACVKALEAAIKTAALSCQAFPDGMTVRVSAKTAYEPDALVRCGPPLDLDAVEVGDALIVVEVLSPSTQTRDISAKLQGYFQVPSIAHYLILDPFKRMIVHHARGDGDVILTRIVNSGALVLTPPGLSLDVEQMFPAP
ncbi:MAG: Uma2 family endonuclease [Hyphomicrobiales bacterium]|nr:Uma2 family endonuclease [Hyphomicrobiales bacterium]